MVFPDLDDDLSSQYVLSAITLPLGKSNGALILGKPYNRLSVMVGMIVAQNFGFPKQNSIIVVNVRGQEEVHWIKVAYLCKPEYYPACEGFGHLKCKEKMWIMDVRISEIVLMKRIPKTMLMMRNVSIISMSDMPAMLVENSNSKIGGTEVVCGTSTKHEELHERMPHSYDNLHTRISCNPKERSWEI